MTRILGALLAITLLAGFWRGPQTANLGWLAGHWVQDGADGWAEESWTSPRAGVMLGAGLSGKGHEAKSFEFMRIADDPAVGGRVVFWGSPGGKPPVAFPLVREARHEVAFENPRHDYPTRISYKRKGKMLIATISGPGGANPQSWHYRLVRD